MSKVYLEDTTLSAIGDAIRAKTGSSSLILPGNMPAAISGISDSGGGILTLSRVYAAPILCRYNNSKNNYLLPIGDYLPNNINKLKAIIGIAESSSGYSLIWYNNSSNLIEATVTEYVDVNGQLITNAGAVPILINGYGFKVDSGTSYDRNPDQYGCWALIGGQLYSVTQNGNNYIYNRTSDPGENCKDWFIIKEV